jgi:hypothetical protein
MTVVAVSSLLPDVLRVQEVGINAARVHPYYGRCIGLPGPCIVGTGLAPVLARPCPPFPLSWFAPEQHLKLWFVLN